MKKLLTLALAFLLAVISCDVPLKNIDHELSVVKNYAEQYRLDTGKITFLLETPPPEVISALDILRRAKTRQHEAYVLLIMLKLYRNHYRHAHQSYELRANGNREINNPILKEYCRLTGIGPTFFYKPEYLPSDHVYAWIEEHPEVLEYSALATEMQKTKKLIEDWEQRLEQESNERKHTSSHALIEYA